MSKNKLNSVTLMYEYADTHNIDLTQSKSFLTLATNNGLTDFTAHNTYKQHLVNSGYAI